MKMTLAEARKRMIEAASDKSVSFEGFRRHWQRVVRIREAATKEANRKIMEANRKHFPEMPIHSCERGRKGSNLITGGKIFPTEQEEKV